MAKIYRVDTISMNKEKKFLRILKINREKKYIALINQEYLRALSFNYWRTCRMNIIFFKIFVFFHKHLYASIMKLIKVLKINITLFNEGHFYIYFILKFYHNWKNS